MSENKRAGSARPKSPKKTSRPKKSESNREPVSRERDLDRDEDRGDSREEDTVQASSQARESDRDNYDRDDRDERDERHPDDDQDDRPNDRSDDRNDDRDHHDDHRNEVRAEERRPATEPEASRPEGDAPKVSYKPSDFYLSQCYFDRAQNKFIAHVLEFPEVKVTGNTKEQAYKDLERKLEGHLAGMRNRGEQVPDAAHVKHYPEKLEVPVSQTLYRRLDILSRQEKQSLESLVTELLTHAMDKRHGGGGRSGGHQAQSHGERHERHDRNDRDRGHGRDRDRGGNRDRHEDRDNRGNRHQNNRGGQNRRPQGRGYHESLENKENFLEYVRNLEKSGGGAGGWRKK